MNKGIFCFLFAVFFAGSAHADRSGNVCKLYWKSDSSTPAEITDYLSQFKGATLRVCSAPDGVTQRYTSLFPIWAQSSGVCYSWQVDIFPVRTPAGKIRWSDTPSDQGAMNGASSYPLTQLFMAMRDGACPLQGDYRYTAVSGVSEGIFREIMSIWRDLPRDAKRFDAVFSLLSNSQRSSADFAAMKSAMLHKAESGEAVIDRIAVREALPSLRNSSRYILLISDPKDPSQSYQLEADLTSEGIRVFNFEVRAN
jgi:hypothetical protein